MHLLHTTTPDEATTEGGGAAKSTVPCRFGRDLPPCFSGTGVVVRAMRVTAAALLVAVVPACSAADGTSGTTGRSIRLNTQIVIKDDLSQPRTNALGWNVAITKGLLSVGPLYYYSGDPVLSHSAPVARVRALASAWFDWFIKPAHAHPGHYVAGAAMGQMLEATTIDLLQGSVALAPGEGVTGYANSATFSWQSPPVGRLAAELEGHVISMRGTATKGETTIQFLAHADEADVLDGDQKLEVAGCSFGDAPGRVGVDLKRDGIVTLTLVPSVWFDQVDFQSVAPGVVGAPQPDAEGVIDLTGSLAWRGFVRGLKKGTAYEFSYSN
ncbi:MAG TPA: hypothetical protein VKP30_33785 [Polyangiaceae bacterium]|nr:hypothetical protein [Polyangiaceae bacterium]